MALFCSLMHYINAIYAKVFFGNLGFFSSLKIRFMRFIHVGMCKPSLLFHYYLATPLMKTLVFINPVPAELYLACL